MCSEKSDCMVDNIYLEKTYIKYAEYLLSLYRDKHTFNHSGLLLPGVHAWDIPQVMHSHIIIMSKYFKTKFDFPLDKFLTFAFRSWQGLVMTV